MTPLLSTPLTFRQRVWAATQLDAWLVLGIVLLLSVCLITLYSASHQNMVVLERQLLRIGSGFAVMMVLAALPARFYLNLAPLLYAGGIFLLMAIFVMGSISKGAQRWLELGFVKFQPSEMMKIAVPLMLAYLLQMESLPLRFKTVAISLLCMLVPVLFIAKQPDLGTALSVLASGLFVLFFAGLPWRWIGYTVVSCILAAPVFWMLLHDYQKQRIWTLLDPERDPLGTGYHSLQSKIAIGSGGLWGKGWLQGTQSQLDFLPEHTTDFIFAVFCEDFGFAGVVCLLTLYFAVILRMLQLTLSLKRNFHRLFASSVLFTFCFYLFVNMGMVAGILPIVGIPMPLLSYGGTALVTILSSFGILMSMHATCKRQMHG